MDWSNRPGGDSQISINPDEFGDHPELDMSKFIIASRYGVHKGGLHHQLVKDGFVATRISVTSLNLEIVRALGVPSVGMSPFASRWTTCKRNISAADTFQVARSIDSGFVPVLHGDAVYDDLQDCTLLSGDVIICHLAELLKPEYV
ncbi:hypothetical protein MKX01_004212, partial [Papaver californicum]